MSDIGLTAAVSQALTEADIACNGLAGIEHDHLFVSTAQADRALAVFRDLQYVHQKALVPSVHL